MATKYFFDEPGAFNETFYLEVEDFNEELENDARQYREWLEDAKAKDDTDTVKYLYNELIVPNMKQREACRCVMFNLGRLKRTRPYLPSRLHDEFNTIDMRLVFRC